MRYSFMRTFERDRAVSSDELSLLAELVQQDRVVDDDERPVVSRILRRFRRDTVAPEEWNDIERFKRRLGV